MNTNTSLDGQGIFVSFEGGEGVGKSTQIRLLAARLRECGYEVLTLREPGGTEIGERIREILLDPAHSDLDPTSELLLYEAARAQLVSTVILPALQRGVVVLCDRFTDSTRAYQGAARDLGETMVRKINDLATGGLVPHRTIILMRDVETALRKASEDGTDRIEAEGIDFHTRVQEAFLRIASEEPNRVRVIRCEFVKRTTAERVFAEVRDLFTRAQDVSYEITDDLLKQVKREKRNDGC